MDVTVCIMYDWGIERCRNPFNQMLLVRASIQVVIHRHSTNTLVIKQYQLCIVAQVKGVSPLSNSYHKQFALCIFEQVIYTLLLQRWPTAYLIKTPHYYHFTRHVYNAFHGKRRPAFPNTTRLPILNNVDHAMLKESYRPLKCHVPAVLGVCWQFTMRSLELTALGVT